ncbi:hypothetical protein QTN47_17110 [Danxiaibacter flavus]|uniref:Uncharacterized protein n=1 Tax=Danxiaibacter flavus TaxID=3049108 RepID=A0ABV3ZH56_9BACT|nr:hypothetical protein QNM32_17120 [Chitinophagaceae bacterium DXS]
MADETQFKSLTPEELSTFIGRDRWIVINKVTRQPIVCDGQTPGGQPQALATNVNNTFTSSDGKTVVIENGVVKSIT